MLLDKGVVVNADIVVSIGDTELLGVKVRAAIASFETAAEYGLEFPEGTDMDRVEAAAKGERREGLSEAKAPVTVTESSEEELDAAEARGRAEDDDEDEEDDVDVADFLTQKTPVTAQTPATGRTPATFTVCRMVATWLTAEPDGYETDDVMMRLPSRAVR